MRFIIITLILCGSNSLFSQVDLIYTHLEGQIEKLNNESAYENSLRHIDFFENVHTSVESKFYTNLFRSYVYKRVFDYKLNNVYLDKADFFGRKSPDSVFFKQVILAQKSMASFDITDYKRASKLMDSIRINGVEILSLEDQGKILMQEAYINFLNGENANAKKLLYNSLLLMDKSTPQHKPMAYGKLLEIYGSEQDIEMVQQIAAKAISCAQVHGIVKYEIYIHSILTETYQKLGLTEKAFHSLKRKSELEHQLNEKENELRHYYLDKIDSLSKLSQNDKANFKVFFIISFSLLLALIFYLKRSRKHFKGGLNEARDLYPEILDESDRSELPRPTFYSNDSSFSNTQIKEVEATKSDDLEILDKSSISLNNEMQLDDVESQSPRDLLLERGLSIRQVDIVELFIKGDSKKIIASELIISENTVKYHLKKVYATLGVSNRAELITFVQNKVNS